MADNYIEKRNEQYASQKAAWMNKSSFARKRAMERMRKHNEENEAKIKAEHEANLSTENKTDENETEPSPANV